MRSLGKRIDEISRLDPKAVREASSRHGEVLAVFNDWSAELAEYVTLRFFAGRSNAEAAEVLGISPRTGERHWAFARAWLNRHLTA